VSRGVALACVWLVFASIHAVLFFDPQSQFTTGLMVLRSEYQRSSSAAQTARCTTAVPKRCAEMWATCMKTHVNHHDQNTTSIAEGWHSSVKSWIRSQGSENSRLDWLIHFLLIWIGDSNLHKDVCRHYGATSIARRSELQKDCELK
jgi:hypothetical protein